MKRGVPVRLTVENGLPTPTSLDLQGVRTSPPLGGTGPLGGAVMPGASAEVIVTPPDSGTSWFHPWILDPRTDATAQGLASALIVEEPAPPDVDADVVALLADRWLPPPGGGPAARLRIGDDAWPRREALPPGSRVRLRLINASTRQAVMVACAGAAPSIVAIDGQPSALLRPRGNAVPLGPGARCDLIVDLPRRAGAEVTFSVLVAGAGDPALVFRAEGEASAGRDPVAALPENPLLPAVIALEKAVRATLVAASTPGAPSPWTVNGASGVALPKAPLFRVGRGTPVTLTFRNASGRLVGFRVHGVALRRLHDRDDGWEPYWVDTLMVPPGATHHAAFVADLPGRWLIESPFFDQAAGGLRCWFEVS